MNLALNEIHLGDCLELMPHIPSASIDMILCDLPYGTTRNAWDSVIDLPQLWSEYERVIKLNGAILLTAQTPFDKVLAVSNLKLLRYEWIWEKTSATGHLNAKRMPMKAHENILVFYKSLPKYNPQKTTGHVRKVSSAEHKRNSQFSSNYGTYEHTGYDSTDRYPRSVIKFATDKQRLKLHPTQKPEALMQYLIRTYTDRGDVILDNAIGSGTTAVAAVSEGRRFIGIENHEAYHRLAVQRVHERQDSMRGLALEGATLIEGLAAETAGVVPR